MQKDISLVSIYFEVKVPIFDLFPKKSLDLLINQNYLKKNTTASALLCQNPFLCKNIQVLIISSPLKILKCFEQSYYNFKKK